MNIRYLLVSSIKNALAIGYILILLLCAIMLLANNNMPYEGGFFKNFALLGGMLCLCRLIFGGWSILTIKALTWQAIMSTLGGILFIALGMHHGHHSFSLWPYIWPICVATGLGIWAYKIIDTLIEESREYDPEELLNSVDKIGFRNTFNALMADGEMDLLYAVGRGVSIYSNTIILIGIILWGYYY